MKPMLFTDAIETPIGDECLYETKYDGFRCTLELVGEVPLLICRNGNELNKMFPDIIDFCIRIYKQIKSHLPLFLDGELVYLANNFQSNFSIASKEVECEIRKSFQNTLKHSRVIM